MNRSLALTLTFFSLFSSVGSADIIIEDFETFAEGQVLPGTDGWAGLGQAGWFQARAPQPGGPAALGGRVASLSNNAEGTSATPAWLNQSFTPVTGGSSSLFFDVLFQASGATGLNSCEIYLSDADKTPGLTNYDVGTLATINVGKGGLLVHDGNFWPVINVSLTNDQWYRFKIDVDLDGRTWGLQIADWSGETLGAYVQAQRPSTTGTESVFGFRDDSIDDLGMLEFLAADDIMDDPAGRGFLVDNINVVPEPLSLGLLLGGGALLLRKPRRK